MYTSIKNPCTILQCLGCQFGYIYYDIGTCVAQIWSTRFEKTCWKIVERNENRKLSGIYNFIEAYTLANTCIYMSSPQSITCFEETQGTVIYGLEPRRAEARTPCLALLKIVIFTDPLLGGFLLEELAMLGCRSAQSCFRWSFSWPFTKLPSVLLISFFLFLKLVMQWRYVWTFQCNCRYKY